MDAGADPHPGLKEDIVVGGADSAAGISCAQSSIHPQLSPQDLWYLHYSSQLHLAFRQRQTRQEALVIFSDCCNSHRGFWMPLFSTSVKQRRHRGQALPLMNFTQTQRTSG